ncbi:MAG: hypothetical protein Q7S90_03460, partial [Rubrivivax sp.]|nr:hypothetical protein [Rubrivivax sp.]
RGVGHGEALGVQDAQLMRVRAAPGREFSLAGRHRAAYRDFIGSVIRARPGACAREAPTR